MGNLAVDCRVFDKTNPNLPGSFLSEPYFHLLKNKRSNNDHRKWNPRDLNSPLREFFICSLGIVATLLVRWQKYFFVCVSLIGNPAVGNCKCRLNFSDYYMHKEARAQAVQCPYLIPCKKWDIFFRNCGYLDIVTLFRGSLKLNGIFWGIVSHFWLATTIIFWGIFIRTVSQPA